MKKVFGIGLSRTGTTSLAQALNEAGINVIHYATNKEILFDVQGHGSCDIPTTAHYKELDTNFPNSKFVYTIRDKDEWLVSIEKYLKQKEGRTLGQWHLQNRIAIYGRVDFNKEMFAKKYDEHDSAVRAYFKDREDDLLVLNICSGEPWKKLADFLDMPDNGSGFPHENKRK